MTLRASNPIGFTFIATSNHNREYPLSPPRGGAEEGLDDRPTMMTTRNRSRTLNQDQDVFNMMMTRSRTRTMNQINEERVCSGCGKEFKNRKGVKIHQGKTKCVQRQRLGGTASSSSQTGEGRSQVETHSVSVLSAIEEGVFSTLHTPTDVASTSGDQSQGIESDDVFVDTDTPLLQNEVFELQSMTQLLADSPGFESTELSTGRNLDADQDGLLELQSVTQLLVEGTDEREDHVQREDNRALNFPSKPRLQWPKSNEEAAWKHLDEDIHMSLELNLKGTAQDKLIAMTDMVFNICRERFEVVVKGKQPASSGPSRRQKEISEIRSQLRQLTKRWKNSIDEEREGLHQLREELRGRLVTLRRAERYRKKRAEKRRRKEKFLSNPYKFTKDLLGKDASGQLKCSQEELENHLHEVHSDANWNEELPEFDWMDEEQPPKVPLDMDDLKFSEVKEVVMKAKTNSAPGPSGLPYKVYKKCPQLLKRLWRLLRVIWRTKKLPWRWGKAEGVYIPKVKDSIKIGDFRPISLLDVEGKIFFAIIANRLTKYLLENEYVSPSVQKGGIPGYSGCIEHNSMITELLKDAKRTKKDMSVIWLDMANAYGSMPHKLIEKAMKTYHLPENLRNLLQEYFEETRMRFSANDFTTRWQPLQKGIMTGCTISIILFVMGMNLLIKRATKECRGPLIQDRRLPPVRAFVDDLTITTQSTVGAGWILKKLAELASWARMSFKVAKSRSLVLVKGKVDPHDVFRMDNEVIPSVCRVPVKYLGKVYDGSLKDVNQAEITIKELSSNLKKIDNSGLPGRFKVWCFQFGLFPKVMWPVTVYDFPITFVERMERKVSSWIRKWLGLPPSFTRLGLYMKAAALSLPVRSLVEEYKVSKARTVMTLRDSRDKDVSGVSVHVETGRSWKADKAVADAESRLRHKDIVGAVCQGRQGFGTVKFQRWKTSRGKERRKMVLDEIRLMEDEKRHSQIVGMRKQGAWTNWEGVQSRKLTAGDLLSSNQYRISFLLQSVYDVLPTPTNLKVWGKSDDDRCSACGSRCTLQHVLTSCKVALSEGKYTWRHDKILKEIAHILDLERRKTSAVCTTVIQFCREGESTRKKETGLLSMADDWQMLADIGSRLVFPTHIAVTNLRPDIVLWSDVKKMVVLIELTVPWETRVEEAHELKSLKYSDLSHDCATNGWRCFCMPIEVGCRGFIANSVWRLMKLLGISATSRKTLTKSITKAAEEATTWLWLQRNNRWQSRH